MKRSCKGFTLIELLIKETLMLAASHPFVSGLYRMDSKGHLLPP